MTTQTKKIKLSKAQMEIVRTIAYADIIRGIVADRAKMPNTFYEYYINNHFTVRQRAIIEVFSVVRTDLAGHFEKALSETESTP